MNIMSFRAVTSRLRPNKHQQKVLEETRPVCMRLWNRLENRFGRISDPRSNHLSHVAKSMVESYRFIAMEDIDIKRLVEKEWRSTRRSQYNASWGILEDRLTRAAERSGTTVVEVDPRGTSQMCSGCGRIVAKDLSVRVHDCPHCGLVMNRDRNASINILAAGRAASAPSREPRGRNPTLRPIGDTNSDVT